MMSIHTDIRISSWRRSSRARLFRPVALPHTEQSTDLNSRWQRILTGGAHRWPGPTSEIFEKFQFELSYANIPLMHFDWVDYNGGHIARGRDPQLVEVQKLQERVKDSSCLFLCVSGEHLTDNLTMKTAKEDIQVHGMAALMRGLIPTIRPTRQLPFPVVIVITKYDYCLAQKRGETGIISTIQHLFNPVFARAGGFITAICPVTLGDALTHDRLHGQINPLNIHHPLFFVSWAHLRQTLVDAATLGLTPAEITDVKNKFMSLGEVLRNVPIFLDGDKIVATDQPI